MKQFGRFSGVPGVFRGQGYILGDGWPEIRIGGDGKADEGVAQDGGEDQHGEEQAQADRQDLPLSTIVNKNYGGKNQPAF